tara:strand:- start:212 stop:367 length:156 start_codon:yes stop_codon:yes gene_type:complete
MHSESHGGSMNLHDQVTHIRNGHDTLNNGLQSARSVSGYDEMINQDPERIS